MHLKCQGHCLTSHHHCCLEIREEHCSRHFSSNLLLLLLHVPVTATLPYIIPLRRNFLPPRNHNLAPSAAITIRPMDDKTSTDKQQASHCTLSLLRSRKGQRASRLFFSERPGRARRLGLTDQILPLLFSCSSKEVDLLGVGQGCSFRGSLTNGRTESSRSEGTRTLGARRRPSKPN